MRSPVKSLWRISNPRLPVVLLIILPVSFFVSCAGGPQPAPDSAGNPVVVASMSLVGDTSFDCSGFVLETYRRAGIDLAPFMNRYTGNGVARMFALALDYGLLTGDNLQPGDVIFWDNTYDRNGDGVWNDPLTHTGIVTAVNADGTVEFTHSHYRDGVVIAQMDLNDPGAAERNAAMRMRGQTSPGGLWTAGQLFRDGAAFYNLP